MRRLKYVRFIHNFSLKVILVILSVLFASSIHAEEWFTKYEQYVEVNSGHYFHQSLLKESLNFEKVDKLITLIKNTKNYDFPCSLIFLTSERVFKKEKNNNDSRNEIDRIIRLFCKHFSKLAPYECSLVLVDYAYDKDSFDSEVQELIKNQEGERLLFFMRNLTRQSFSDNSAIYYFKYIINNVEDFNEVLGAFLYVGYRSSNGYVINFNKYLGLPFLLKFKKELETFFETHGAKMNRVDRKLNPARSALYDIAWTNIRFLYQVDYKKTYDNKFFLDNLLEYLKNAHTETPLDDFHAMLIQDLEAKEYTGIKNLYLFSAVLDIDANPERYVPIDSFEEEKEAFLKRFKDAKTIERRALLREFFRKSFKIK